MLKQVNNVINFPSIIIKLSFNVPFNAGFDKICMSTVGIGSLDQKDVLHKHIDMSLKN